MQKTILLIVALLLCSCARGDDNGSSTAHECVVLLHGLARTSQSMEPMARALEESGFQVANIDYPSRDFPIEELAPMAVEAGIEACAGKGMLSAVHFVTHSLGGILVRYYFAEYDLDMLGRVVMLAPPNQGSHAADAMQGVPGFEWLNGPAGYQLGKGEESVPLQLGTPDFEFAVVAGRRTIDPVTSAVLENPDDGRVSVSDTRLEGMQDFRIVGSSHAFIMQKSEVIELVERFLKNGSFND
jgi:pimeloyl-ACP methyl ester carboxylesterase